MPLPLLQKIMRLPLKGSDYACTRVNAPMEKIQQSYLAAMIPHIQMHAVSAMLGDGTVTQTNTFDPARVRAFYKDLARKLAERGWSPSEIASSDTEDLRRIFFQVSKEVGKYHLSGYFGIQYHALPYYKVDKRVIEIQKELARLADRAGVVFGFMSSAANKALRTELEKKGYAELEFQELFTKMFDDEKLVKELDSKSAAVEQEFSEFEEIKTKKAELFDELNDLLFELYQTSPVSIDHNRQMQGEEGVTTYFDLELIRNKKTGVRDAFVDSARVPASWADSLAGELDAAESLIRELQVRP